MCIDSSKRVLEMANIYDMLSGIWQCEQSGRDETAPLYSCPAAGVETNNLQLSIHTVTDPHNYPLPADLAGVDVAYFLRSQRAPT